MQTLPASPLPILEAIGRLQSQVASHKSLVANSVEEMALATGAHLGHYEIQSALGAGGMGEV